MNETPVQDRLTVANKEAFTRATAGYELFGEKLEPFSAMRQAAAANMGLRFGLVDEQDIFTVTVETLKQGKLSLKFYNQLFADVVYTLWLCTVPMSRVLRVLRKIDEGKEEAFAWADQAGISLTSKEYYDAAAIFLQMMQDITVSTVVPDVSNNGEGDDDDDDDPKNE